MSCLEQFAVCALVQDVLQDDALVAAHLGDLPIYGQARGEMVMSDWVIVEGLPGQARQSAPRQGLPA